MQTNSREALRGKEGGVRVYLVRGQYTSCSGYTLELGLAAFQFRPAAVCSSVCRVYYARRCCRRLNSANKNKLLTFLLSVLKTFSGHSNVKGAFYLIILQVSWERYF